MNMLNGPSEYRAVNDTYPFEDYAQYDAPIFDVEHIEKVRKEHFPVDCQKAYDFGKRLAEKVK